MGAIDRLKNYRTLWALVLPHVTVPAPDEVVMWMTYSHKAVEAAILRTAKRFAKGRIGPKFHPVMTYRYAAGVAKAIDREKGLVPRTTGSDSQSLATYVTPKGAIDEQLKH